MNITKTVIFFTLIFCTKTQYKYIQPEDHLKYYQPEPIQNLVFETLGQFYSCLQVASQCPGFNKDEFQEQYLKCFKAIEEIGKELKGKYFCKTNFIEALESLKEIGTHCSKTDNKTQILLVPIYRKLNVQICSALAMKLIEQNQDQTIEEQSVLQLSRAISFLLWNCCNEYVIENFFAILNPIFGRQPENLEALSFLIEYFKENFRLGFHTKAQRDFMKKITDKRLSAMIFDQIIQLEV